MEMKTTWGQWPQYNRDHVNAVERVVKSGQLFASGEVAEFEAEYQAHLGSGYVRGVGNATQGLHLVLAGLDIGVGDEVIVTPYSWISTASAILMQNAVPVFADIESSTLGLCPTNVETLITRKTKAIIVTHMLGYQASILELTKLAARYKVMLIEDASHAHGATLGGTPLGTFGDASVFSLHQRKAISTGDGGLVWCREKRLADKIYRLRSFGDAELSYNYRMTEFSAALGRVGLKSLAAENSQRRWAANYLSASLKDLSELKIRISNDHEGAVYYAVALEVTDPTYQAKSENLIHECERLGIPLRKTWSPLHKHPHFNPEKIPARGVPWATDGKSRQERTEYRNLDLKVTNNLLPDLILELYCHPGTTSDALDTFCQLANKALSRP